MKNDAYLRGLGFYAPERILTNADLERMVETSDEWITTRTGIKERHIAAPGETVSDLAAKAATARDLGADEIVNYRQEQVADYVERLTGGAGFDLVLDTVGGANLDASFAAARPEGQVVSTNTRSAHDLSVLHAKALSLHVVFMLLPLITGRDRARFGRILRQVARLVQAGELRPLLDERRFTLDSAAQAHALVEQGQARGKVVVDIA